MTCAACAARIEKVLNRAPASDAEVNFATETAHVEYDPAQTTPDGLIEAVRRAGYDAAPAVGPVRRSPSEAACLEARRYRRDLAFFAFAALLTAPLVAQMGYMFATGRHDSRVARLAAVRARDAGAIRRGRAFLPRRLQCAARWRRQHGRAGGAWHRRRATYYRLPSGCCRSPAQHVYFEAGAMIITLVLLGKLLEGARAGAHRVRDPQPAAPAAADRAQWTGERFDDVALAAVRLGDRVSRSRAATPCRWTAACSTGNRRSTKRCSRARAGRLRRPNERTSLPARSTTTAR